MQQIDERLAEVILDRGLVPAERLEQCRKAVEQGAAPSLADALVEAGCLERPQVEQLLAGPGPLAANAVIGGCELIEKLGGGGSALVYKARQISLSRTVAIKLLRPSRSRDAAYLERFLREARTAAKLNHSNVVQAVDSGCDQGYHYFVMEYVDGLTVAQRLRSGPMEESEALKVAKDVASALAHAERYGIVHRDVKPDNIMLAKNGTAKLADLGIATSTAFEADVAAEGKTIGTPHYMSPEQARNQAEIDIRSDIYSLGATLYHMLTGSTPFSGDTPARILAKRLAEPPPDPRDARPELSAASAALVLRMMAREPADRFATAQELLEALDDTIRANEQAPPLLRAARPRSRAARRSTSPRIRSAALLGAGALGLALLCVLALLGFGNHHPGQSASATEFHEAVEYIRGNPDDVDGAAARLTAFIEKYPGGPQAEEAKAALVELDAARVQLAQQAMFAALKDECLRLIQQDDFGTALRRIEPYGAALPRDIADMVFAAADAKLSRYIRQAGTALAAKDYAGARKALDLAEKLGVPGFAKTIKQKRQEADSHEANAELWAKWEAAKTESNKLLAKDDHEQAAKALEAVKSCGLPEIERLAADRLSAIEKVRTQAASAAAERVRSALREEVEPHLAARRYAEAKAALAVLSDDGLFRAASEILQAAARDVECLQVFWQGVANRLGSLKEGTGLSLDGKAVRFVGLKDGKMRYGTGQVETAIDLLALSARDVLGILGPELYADSGEAAELRSRAGLFLMLDRDADAAQAWKVLTAKPPAPGDSDDLRRYREMATRTIVLKFEAAEKAAEAAFALFRSDPARQPGDAFRTQHRQTRLYNEHLHDLRLAAAADAVVKRLTTWSNHYYLLIPESATWQAAKTRCEQLGGHLATVTTFQEHTFVLREFMKQLPGGNWPSLWLGATNGGREGRWEWVTGERWGFTNWIRGEPNNEGDGGEHFLQLWRPREGIGWNDNNSNVRLQFVCEWDAAPRLTLDALRDLAAVTKAAPPRPTPADCRKRLAERVSCSFVAAPLSYALVAALNQVQVPYQWERSSKAIADHALQIVSFQADNQPAGDALKRLLDTLGLRWDMDDKGLILQPIQSLSEKN